METLQPGSDHVSLLQCTVDPSPQFSTLGFDILDLISLFHAAPRTRISSPAPAAQPTVGTPQATFVTKWGKVKKIDPESSSASSVRSSPVKHLRTLRASSSRSQPVKASQVPANANGERVDPPAPRFLKKQFDDFNALSNKRKFCNDYHLKGTCSTAACPFNHEPITPTQTQMLAALARTMRCPQNGNCRDVRCWRGHYCQKSNCASICAFSRDQHDIDTLVVTGSATPSGFFPSES